MRLRRRKQKYRRGLAGESLCGFYGFFEVDWGDPETPEPYDVVVPSFVGNSMLPFRCPRCRKPAQDLACPKTRESYHDTRGGRDNYWCPNCGWRFRIDLNGTPLAKTLRAGTAVAPALLVRGGKSTWIDGGANYRALAGVN